MIYKIFSLAISSFKILYNAYFKVAGKIRNPGRETLALEGDVSEEEDVKRAIQTVIDKFGKIDILACNTGIVNWSPAEDVTLENRKKVIDVNLTGVFLFCKWVGKEMIKQGNGSIINISSMSAIIVNTPQKQCHYNTSKAAVSHLTKSLAVEWASRTPQKRIADPSESKGLCVFLASRTSSYVTGSAIVIDGGYTLW